MSGRGANRLLSLRDVTSLIVGVIIGVGIFQTMPDVARGAGSWWGSLLLWAGGGLLSFCGALGYAELASADPRPGGDYVYLGEAYGPRAGFLFGWLQTVVARPGDIAVMAFAFATYARAATGWEIDLRLPAAAAVVVTTLVNVLGVRQGAGLQNWLTGAKVLGLLVVAGIALAAWGRAPLPVGVVAGSDAAGRVPLQVALILVLFTYGGWNEAAYVAAEMENPRRNVVRALLLGTGAVTLLYMLLNAAFLGALGFGCVAASSAVAVDAVSAGGPAEGAGAAGRIIGALIAVSALGAVNGLVFTGARITDAVAADHRAFRRLARTEGMGQTPAGALLLQGALALALVVVLGSFVDTVMYTAAAVYAFYLATSVAVLVLRRRRAPQAGAFRLPWYPWPTLVFCATCLFLIHGAVVYRPWIAAASLGLVLAGLPVHRLVSRSDAQRGGG